MDRRTTLIVAGATGAVVAAGGLLLYVEARARARRTTPEWTDAHQPPDGIAAQPTAIASWCAARPPVPALRAGNRVLRTYPPTLVAEPSSLIEER